MPTAQELASQETPGLTVVVHHDEGPTISVSSRPSSASQRSIAVAIPALLFAAARALKEDWREAVVFFGIAVIAFGGAYVVFRRGARHEICKLHDEDVAFAGVHYLYQDQWSFHAEPVGWWQPRRWKLVAEARNRPVRGEPLAGLSAVQARYVADLCTAAQADYLVRAKLIRVAALSREALADT